MALTGVDRGNTVQWLEPVTDKDDGFAVVLNQVFRLADFLPALGASKEGVRNGHIPVCVLLLSVNVNTLFVKIHVLPFQVEQFTRPRTNTKVEGNLHSGGT